MARNGAHSEEEEPDTPLLGQPAPAEFAGNGNDDHGSMDGRLRRRRRAVGADGRKVTIFVETPADESIELKVDLSSETIGDVKASLEKKKGYSQRQQHLYFNGKQLDNDRILADCGIQEGSTLDLLLHLHGPASTPEMANHDEAHGKVVENIPLLRQPPAVLDEGLRRRPLVPGEKANIVVKFITGHSFPLRVHLAGTIADVKILMREKGGFPKKDQQISLDKKILGSHRILADCGVEEGSVLFLFLPLRGGGDPRDACIKAWEKLKLLIDNKVIFYDKNSSNAVLDAGPRKRWSNYSLKAFLFAIAMFSSYLDHSASSASLTTRDIFFVIAFLLFLITYALLSTMQPYWGNALVHISGLLLESVLCLLMVSFSAYYAFSILIALVLIVAVALLHRQLKHTITNMDNDNDVEESSELDNLFDLSQGIATCGGLITAVSGHYMVGSFSLVGFLIFMTVAAGLYLMIVATVRAASRRHATWLANMLRALLVVTLSSALITFLVRSGSETQQRDAGKSGHRKILLGLH